MRQDRGRDDGADRRRHLEPEPDAQSIHQAVRRQATGGQMPAVPAGCPFQRRTGPVEGEISDEAG